MKKLLLLVTALTLTIGFSTLVMADVPSEFKENEYKIAWSDEFEGISLDSNVWTPLIGNGATHGNPGWGNQEKEYYKAENASVSDGSLKINAKYEPNAGTERGTTFNFSSARLVTQHKVALGLGYIEARIRIPSAKGIWPAFWSMGTNGLVWPRCGEIDIMEAFNTNNKLQSTIHYPRISDENDLCNYKVSTRSDKTEWHTYGCYRDGNVVAFYIDRKLTQSYATADGTYSCYQNYPWQAGSWEGRRSVLNDDQFLLLNVACGGNLAGGDPDSTLNVDMVVDYVRHYVYDPEQTTTEEQTTIPVIVPTLKPTSKIIPTVSVAKAKVKKLKNVKKKKLKVTIKRVKGAQGYQVRWCDNKKFDGYEQKTTKKLKFTIKGLDKKTTYWVKARAFKKVNGAKVYGKWSAAKKKKIKK